jgi:thiamine biosynthesis protein ThiS
MNEPTLHVTVNGEERMLPSPCTVAQLLVLLELDARLIAIERNKKLVRRAQFDSEALAEGDRIEIVTFVGGG